MEEFIMNYEGKILKLLEDSNNHKRNVEVFRSDENGNYHRLFGKTQFPLHQLDVLIWKNGKLTYNFSSAKESDKRIFISIKKSKKLLVTDSQKNTFFFECGSGEENSTNTTALIVVTTDDDISLIVASNIADEIDRFITLNENNGESFEQLLAIISNNFTKAEINTFKGGEKIEGQNFTLPALE